MRQHLMRQQVPCSLLFLLLSTVTVSAGNGGSDWPRFLGPSGTSVSTEKGILTPWPASGLRVVWTKELGTGYGAPAISRGKLFQFDRVRNQARLQCLDARTGTLVWKVEYPTAYKDFFGYNNGPRCCPVVEGERVFTYGAEGMLHCLAAADGKLLWKVDTHAQFNVMQNFFGVGSAPVVEGDLVIVQVGGSPKGSILRNLGDIAKLKGDNSGVVAFDKADGTVRYRISDELASYSSPHLATIEGRRWCFMFARGGLLAFEPTSGKIDFHFPWRLRGSRERQRGQPSRYRRPGADLGNVWPGQRAAQGQTRWLRGHSGMTPRNFARACNATGTRRSSMTASSTGAVAGTRIMPSCAASNWRLEKFNGASPV